MKVLVNGEVKELTAIDNSNGVEWTKDFIDIGNRDEFKWNDEINMYETDIETFEWWSDIIDKQNRVSEMEQQLSEEDRKRYINDNGNWCDLETTVNQQLSWLEENI